MTDTNVVATAKAIDEICATYLMAAKKMRTAVALHVTRTGDHLVNFPLIPLEFQEWCHEKIISKTSNCNKTAA